MKHEKLTEAISMVDDDLIAESANAKSKKSNILNIKHFTIKKTLILVACFVLLISCITATAKSMKSSWASKIAIQDGSSEIVLNENIKCIKINDNASKDDQCEMSLKEVSDMLGVSFFDSEMARSVKVNYRPTIIDGDIQAVYIDYNCIKYNIEGKYINCSINFLTDLATEHVSPEDCEGGRFLIGDHKLKNFDATAVITGVDWNETRFTAFIEYNNMQYKFIGNGISQDELIAVLDSIY